MTDKEIIKGLQAVNEHIGKHFNEGGAWMAEFIDNAIKALEQTELSPSYNGVKSELEQTSWIPCSERLPEKQDCYLVTTKWKGSYSGDVYIETNMAVYREKQKEWDCVDIIAWMPLPEPYIESEEEE